MKKWRKHSIAAAGAIAATNLAPGAPAAEAAYVNQGTWFSMRFNMSGDSFDNYDYLERCENRTDMSCGARNPNEVDWAIDLLFRDNADIDRVKRTADYRFPRDEAGLKNQVISPSVWGWDEDRGRKYHEGGWGGGTCPGNANMHYRVYADGDDGALYNTEVGYFVVGSAHNDYREGCSGAYTGDNDAAEGYVADAFGDKGYTVTKNAWDFFNKETIWQGNHRWSNNGLATQIRLP